MSAYKSVIVGTDGSGTATLAVRAAGLVAQKIGVRVTVVTAFERGMFDEPPPAIAAQYPGGFDSGAEARWAMDASLEAAATLRGEGFDARQATVPGSPADALDDLASDIPDSLIVVGTKGLTDASERIVGNVPHELTHHAHHDILMVTTTDGTPRTGWATAALATDGSDTALEACRRGLALSDSLGAIPTLLTAAKDEATGRAVLEASAAALGRPDIEGRVVMTDGDPGAAVAEAGGEYDLLVMGNKGMSGIRRLLGSVPNTVTHRVPTDLLLVNTTRG